MAIQALGKSLGKFSNGFLNSNLMSAQEAVYHALSLPLWKNSRKTIFINIHPTQERIQMLKSKTELNALNSDSDDIFMEDIFTKYSKRPLSMESVCLASFASTYTASNVNDIDNDDEDEEIQNYRTRQKSAIIRYRRYKLVQDPVNFFRENVLLFLPC